LTAKRLVVSLYYGSQPQVNPQQREGIRWQTGRSRVEPV